MITRTGSCVTLCMLLLSACGPASRQTKVYPAGEKATVDKLTYAVIDTQIHPRLGEEQNARFPQNRFYAVQLAVSSGASTEVLIPAMTLVDDSGKTYTELADGSGLQHWLGVVRRVSPGQTERGEILFDAPAAHYKLKLTDETDADDVFIELPLNFVNEQMSHEAAGNDIVAPVEPERLAPAVGKTPATKTPATKK
jgi:hypothetical protein